MSDVRESVRVCECVDVLPALSVINHVHYLTRYRWARKQIYKGWRGPLRGRPAVQLGIL